MRKPNRIDAIIALVGPEVSGACDGSEVHYHAEQTPPSDSAIDAKFVELEAEYDAKQYQRDRQYPQLGEQLDMLFHDMTAGKGTKDGEWYKAIAKVKDDNPKPTE